MNPNITNLKVSPDKLKWSFNDIFSNSEITLEIKPININNGVIIIADSQFNTKTGKNKQNNISIYTDEIPLMIKGLYKVYLMNKKESK